MKVLNSPPIVLPENLYRFGINTMREQSMFISPRFYMGSEINNYDLWKLAAWYDNTNKATRELERSIELYAKPLAQTFYKEPELRELMFCCGGTRHSNKTFIDHNYLNGVSHRAHYIHEGSGWITDVGAKESTSFAPGSVMLFSPEDAGKKWHISFNTPILSATVAVWSEASTKKNWVLFAEHMAKYNKPQELKVFDI